MRAVEANWPSAGTRLYRASGVWPLVTRDESVVEKVEPNRRLVLLAKGGVLGQARGDLDLQPVDDAAVVTMTETRWPTTGKWGAQSCQPSHPDPAQRRSAGPSRVHRRAPHATERVVGC